MKKGIAFIFAAFVLQVAIAQQAQPGYINNPYPKTITVSGSAEMEVVPDEIFVNIELKEYQKKGESKKNLEIIRSQFLASCKAVGIPDSLVSIFSYSGNGNYYSRKKKKDPNLAAGIVYQVKFRSSKTMDDLVEKLDDDATQNFKIVAANHSKMIEFRRQLKIGAVQAAKEKGIYLTDAIGEKLGEAVNITEPGEWTAPLINSYLSNSQIDYNRLPNQAGDGGNTEVDFKKIKLRFEVSVVFAMK